MRLALATEGLHPVSSSLDCKGTALARVLSRAALDSYGCNGGSAYISGHREPGDHKSSSAKFPPQCLIPFHSVGEASLHQLDAFSRVTG